MGTVMRPPFRGKDLRNIVHSMRITKGTRKYNFWSLTKVTVPYFVHHDTLLQSPTYIITNCDNSFITKCGKKIIAKCDSFITNVTVITKCKVYYKKRRCKVTGTWWGW